MPKPEGKLPALRNDQKRSVWESRFVPKILTLWKSGKIGPDTKLGDVKKAVDDTGNFPQGTFRTFWYKLQNELRDGGKKEELDAYLTEDDVEDDYPLTFAPKRAKILGGLPTSDDIEADNTFKPPTNFVPFVNNNGDHMLAVEMLLPSGYYNNKERYWVELDGDKIIVTIKMPRLLEDHINMFYAIVGEDEKLQGMMHSANKVSIAKHQKNAGGDILMTAEVDLPSTPVVDTFITSTVKEKATTVVFLVAYFTMMKFADGTAQDIEEHIV